MKIEMPKILDTLTEYDVMQDIVQKSVNEEEDMKDFHFFNANLQGVQADVIDFHGGVFENCKFTLCTFHNLYFADIIFMNCDISNVDFTKCFFRRVQFQNCKVLGANFAEATFDSVSMQNCNCKFINASLVKIKNSLFEHTDFSNANFQQGSIKSVALKDCKFIEAEFLHAPLKGVDFTSSDISGILLSGPELQGAIVTAVQACDLSRYLGLIVR